MHSVTNGLTFRKILVTTITFILAGSALVAVNQVATGAPAVPTLSASPSTIYACPPLDFGATFTDARRKFYIKNQDGTYADLPFALGSTTRQVINGAENDFFELVITNEVLGSSSQETCNSDLYLVGTYLVFLDKTDGLTHKFFTSQALQTSNQGYVIKIRSNNTSGWLRLSDTNNTQNLSFELSVSSPNPPNSPGTPSASVVSATSVSLSWAPSTTVGSTYSVTYSPNNDGSSATCTAPSNTNPVTSTCTGNFVQGTSYTFSVVAYSGGLSSTPVTTTATPNPASPPNPPGTPSFTVVNTTSVSLSWAPSTTAGSTYSVTYSPNNDGSSATCSSPSNSDPVTSTCSGNFVQGTSYTFSVVANSGGLLSSPVTTTATPNPASSPPNNGGNFNGPSIPSAPTINLPSGSDGSNLGSASTQPGQVFTLTGSGMNNVNTVNVGSQKAVITLKTATKLGFKIPKNLPAGLHDLSLYGSFGSMTEAKFFSIAKKKIKTRALGFAGNSPALTSAQKSEMRIFLNELPGKVTLVCNGSTSSPTVTAFDRKLARDRATKACDYARELNPTLQTEIRITPAAGVGYKYRSVKLTLKNY